MYVCMYVKVHINQCNFIMTVCYEQGQCSFTIRGRPSKINLLSRSDEVNRGFSLPIYSFRVIRSRMMKWAVPIFAVSVAEDLGVGGRVMSK
jgi:hypothetical protein